VYATSITDVTSGVRVADGLSPLNESRLAVLNADRSDEFNGLAQNDFIDQQNTTELIAENEFATTAESQMSEINVLDQSNQRALSNDEHVNSATAENEVNSRTDENSSLEETNLNVAESNPLNPTVNSHFENRYNPLDHENGNNRNDPVMNGDSENNLSQSAAQNQQASNQRNKNADIPRLVLTQEMNVFKPTEMPFISLVNITPQKLGRIHKFSLLAGAGKGKGYGTEELLLTNRFYGGLAYHTQGFGKFRKFEIGGNVLLNYSDHQDLKNETTTDSFKLDGTTQRHFLKYSVYELYYLNANINVSFEVFPKHKLIFGMGLSKVVSAKSNLATNVRGGGDTGEQFVYLGKSLDIINQNHEIPTGIRQLDVGFTLGYEFQINRSFSIQLVGNCGLFDRSNNDYFQNQNLSNTYQSIRDNEKRFTVGLKYNLFTAIK